MSSKVAGVSETPNKGFKRIEDPEVLELLGRINDIAEASRKETEALLEQAKQIHHKAAAEIEMLQERAAEAAGLEDPPSGCKWRFDVTYIRDGIAHAIAHEQTMQDLIGDMVGALGKGRPGSIDVPGTPGAVN